MNRLIRCSLIIGLFLSVIGFGTAIVARANGGNWENLNIRNRTMNIGYRERHRRQDMQDLNQMNFQGRLDENMIQFPLASELTLDLTSCIFSISTQDVQDIRISCDSYQEMKDLVWVSAEDDELEIYTTGTDGRAPKIEMVVPSGYQFDEIAICMMSGSCKVSGIYAAELSVDMAGGELEFQNLEVYEADFQCRGGKISYNGEIFGDVEGQCAGGEIIMDLNQGKNEFNYEIEGSAGKITVGDQNFSGIAYKRDIMHNAVWDMELQCVAGKIQVNFLSGQ